MANLHRPTAGQPITRDKSLLDPWLDEISQLTPRSSPVEAPAPVRNRLGLLLPSELPAPHDGSAAPRTPGQTGNQLRNPTAGQSHRFKTRVLAAHPIALGQAIPVRLPIPPLPVETLAIGQHRGRPPRRSALSSTRAANFARPYRDRHR